MAIGPRLDLRQSQSLVMTPQLRQAIKLLQFSNVEVAAFVEEELERNPLLERDEAGDFAAAERPAPDQVAPATPGPADAAEAARSDMLPAEGTGPLDSPEYAETYDPGSASDGVRLGDGHGGSQSFDSDDRGIEDFAENATTLREHLSEQLRLSFHDPVDRLIGAYLIALLEPSGRLSVTSEALAAAMGAEHARVEAVRARMMRFDPTGMFARDLKECLAVQLAEKNRLDPAMQALLDHLDLLARRDMKQLLAVCAVDAADLQDMIAELRRLDPKPGASWDATPPQPVVPDVLMRPAPDGGWLLELNPETMPRLLVNQSFTARVLPRASREDKAFLAEKLQTANWLVKSLQQRAQTILKVSSEIVRQQDAFFRHGVGFLRPLILRDIADAVELHESTVSRVTANKYIATPRGTFELKYFFTTAIAGTSGESHSAEAVRHRIRQMVEAELPDEILSDDAIVAILRREGVDIARRTVAKYRDALRIPSSVQRKREKAVPA
ncbi:RNA polymerase factor sigma-54 [Limobrevibacterium gyesilva]|uniref:RNA polymerase sigma-54 factor n=1 Tax=Limobrevibacterium gyesilva TaxID=2991712 RepID=A0AA42CHG7_9PROT|nr:RNA polymerase factor sigma-54 [Limobrevibacterium gyesilva]MCW3474845.1 RNA polymerase factor sigma-54 [Limobrevibacterium gyesilva]